MGKDSKPRLHVEIGIDGISNSIPHGLRGRLR